MQDSVGVGRGEAGAHFAGEFGGLVGGQAADAAQQAGEILAVDVFHREERLACGFADIVHAAHVGVRDLARDADFLVETRQQILIAARGFGQELEGDGLAQHQIVGAKDFAHAAFAEPRDDPVAAGEQSAGGEALGGGCGWGHLCHRDGFDVVGIGGHAQPVS